MGRAVILRRSADAGDVDAWMLTALAFKAMCCNCMQMDLNVYPNTSSLAQFTSVCSLDEGGQWNGMKLILRRLVLFSYSTTLIKR